MLMFGETVSVQGSNMASLWARGQPETSPRPSWVWQVADMMGCFFLPQTVAKNWLKLVYIYCTLNNDIILLGSIQNIEISVKRGIL